MNRFARTDHRWSMVLVGLLVVISTADAYSKFGRSCKDIGCLSQETCVMAHESCSYTQRDGKDCGSYPTCKRNPNGGSGSDAEVDLDDLVPQHKPPAPPTQTHAEPLYPSLGGGGGGNTNQYNPSSNVGGGGGYVNPGGYVPPGYQPGNDYGGHTPSRPAASGGSSGGGSSGGSTIGNFFSSLGGGGGGSSGSSGLGSILGSLGGSGGGNGGSSSNGLGGILGSLGGSLLAGGAGGGGGSNGSPLTGLINSFTGSNTNNGGGSNDKQGGGFLSGLGGALAGQLIQNALTPKNGGGGGGGGNEGINLRRFGGLFSENPSSGSSADGGRYAAGSTGSRSTTAGGYQSYPTQSSYNPDMYASRQSASSYSSKPSTRYASATKSPVQYGWNV